MFEVDIAMVDTPIGRLAVSAGPEGLVSIDFDVGPDEVARRVKQRVGPCTITGEMHPAAAAVASYFRGQLQAIVPLRVAILGTPFQRQVWAALRKIPAGRTITYSALAASLGRPTATRAVAGANGDNPVPIVVPCHRVIGVDGTLVGYGGGLERKRWLLQHEGALPR